MECVAEVIQAVVLHQSSHSEIESVGGFAVPQFRTCDIVGFYIVHCSEWTQIEMIAKAPAIVDAHLRIEIIVFCLIVVIAALFITDTPEACGYA